METKKSFSFTFNYPKRNTSLVRICIGSISFFLCIFWMNMRAQNSSKLQNRFLFTFILWMLAIVISINTNQTGNTFTFDSLTQYDIWNVTIKSLVGCGGHGFLFCLYKICFFLWDFWAKIWLNIFGWSRSLLWLFLFVWLTD